VAYLICYLLLTIISRTCLRGFDEKSGLGNPGQPAPGTRGARRSRRQCNTPFVNVHPCQPFAVPSVQPPVPHPVPPIAKDHPEGAEI
jgi:hypothetical protein